MLLFVSMLYLILNAKECRDTENTCQSLPGYDKAVGSMVRNGTKRTQLNRIERLASALERTIPMADCAGETG